MFPDIPKSEIRECLTRNYSLAVQNLEKQTTDVLERFDRLLYPKKHLLLAMEKLEAEKLELITAWEHWTDTYENTLWENEIQKQFYEVHRDAIGEEIGRYQKEIWKAKCKINALEGKVYKGRITEAEIETAKQVPIDTLVEVNRAGNFKCLWHEDRNPSAHYYHNGNRFKCFSCQKYGSSIDVVMAQDGCDFLTAVKKLCPPLK